MYIAPTHEYTVPICYRKIVAVLICKKILLHMFPIFLDYGGAVCNFHGECNYVH